MLRIGCWSSNYFIAIYLSLDLIILALYIWVFQCWVHLHVQLLYSVVELILLLLYNVLCFYIFRITFIFHFPRIIFHTFKKSVCLYRWGEFLVAAYNWVLFFYLFYIFLMGNLIGLYSRLLLISEDLPCHFSDCFLVVSYILCFLLPLIYFSSWVLLFLLYVSALPVSFSFPCFHNGGYHLFIYGCKAPMNISYKSGLVMTDCFTFCLSVKHFISPLFLKLLGIIFLADSSFSLSFECIIPFPSGLSGFS